jgi:hypothetical protein
MERPQRTEQVIVRVRPSERALFKKMASKNDMTVSEYIRRLLKYQVKIHIETLGEKDLLTD